MWFEEFELRKPVKHQVGGLGGSQEMYPAECRMRSLTYSAPLYATLCWRIDGEPIERISTKVGEVPVMVGSDFCNLKGMSEE